MADSSGASTPRGKARADAPELRIDMEPPKDEHKHVELKTMKRDAEGSDRSAKGSARGHKPSASVPGVPVLQHLRSFVDTPASHEFLWPTPRGQNNHGHTPVVPHPTASPDLEKQKEADLLKLEAFMFDFAAALLQSGAPVHKTEKVIDDVSRVFEIDSTFIVFPGVVLATFGKLPKTQTSAKRVTVGLNCARLARLDDLAVSIKKKECNLDEAVTLLDTIMKTPPVFGPWIKVLALTVSSGLIAPMFFGGGWRDLITAAVLGTVVGLLGMLSDKYEKLGRLNTILSALIVSFLARIASGYIPGLCRTSINFSAICWLLPGLSVTTAMIEMATRHIISGTTRMFYAFLIAIELGFGIAVGQRIPWFTPFKDDTCKNKLDVRYNALFFPVTVICWNLLMDANPWQWISMSICAAVGYVVSWAMTTKGAVSPDVTAATAAFSVAVVGNLWARLTGHAAIVPILGGILILVPGSLGVRGVLGFLSGNSDNGVTFALQMIIVALSIAVGVFVGQLIEIPKFLCHKKLNKVNIAF